MQYELGMAYYMKYEAKYLRFLLPDHIVQYPMISQHVEPTKYDTIDVRCLQGHVGAKARGRRPHTDSLRRRRSYV